MTLQEDVARALRELRARAGLTIREATQRTGMSRAGLHAWEVERSGSTLEALRQIAEGYGGKVVVMVGGPEDKERLEAAERIGHMTNAEAEPLLRWLSIWDSMPAMERAMIARMAEVRAEMLTNAAEVAEVAPPLPMPARRTRPG